jgi:hypothetical protein
MKLYLVIPGQDHGSEESERLVCAMSPLDACWLLATDMYEDVERFEGPSTSKVADDEWVVFEIPLPLPNRSTVLRWADFNHTVWKPVIEVPAAPK